jgi:outer membrane cobalamin receptor
MQKYRILCLTIFLLSITKISISQSIGDTTSIGAIKQFILNSNHVIVTTDTTRISIISASRSAKYLSDLPLTVYVISHDDIIKNGYTTLTDVLKILPGIRVSQPGTGEYGESFQLRGLLGNQYTKILVNNVPIKPSVVAGMPIGTQLPIRQAERIEVIYGPAAAAYGADAVTGVINIILKEADKGTFVRGDVFVGEGKYNYANFTVGGKAGKNRNILDYTFYGNKSELPNINVYGGHKQAYNPLAILQQQGTKINIGGTFVNPLDITVAMLAANGISEQAFINQYYGGSYKGSLTEPIYENISSSGHLIGLNVKYRGVGLTYNTMYRQTHSSLGLSSLNFRYDNPQNYWADRIQQFSLSYSHDFTNFSTSTNLSFLNYSMDKTSSMGLTKVSSDRLYLYSQSMDLLFEQILNYSPTTNTEIIFGVSYQATSSLPLTSFLDKPFNTRWYNPSGESSFPSHPTMGQFGFNPLIFQNVSGFGQIFSIFRKFNFLTGVRFDANSLYGQTLNPRFAAMYKYSNRLTFISSAGLAFKAPPATMTYRSLAYIPIDEPNNVKYIAIPNTSLEPERYKSLEIGMQITLTKRTTANISAFYNEITNPIVNTIVPVSLLRYPFATAAGDSLWASTYINSSSSKSRLYGVQVNMLIKNISTRYKINGELNLSLAQQSEEAPELVEFLVSNLQLMPRHMGQLRLSAQPSKYFMFRADMVWMSKWLRVLIPFEEIYSKIFSDVDGFFTIDLSANIILDNNLMIMVKGLNLLDEKYGGFGAPGLDKGLLYNPQTGRNFSIGLTYTFN